MDTTKLKQGSKLYNRQTGAFEGLVNFDTLTGKRLDENTYTSQGLSSVIGSDVLNSVQPQLKLPENTPIINENYNLSDVTTPAQQEISRIQAEKTAQGGDISSLMQELGVTQGKEAGFAKEAGADTAQIEYDRFASELVAEQRSNELQKRDILSNALLTKEQAQNNINAIDRSSLQKQADIAILGNAAKGRFDTALSIAKRKVESELAPIQAQLDAKKFIYEQNKDLFSKAELSKLDSLIKADEANIAEQKKIKDSIAEIKVNVATSDAKNKEQLLNDISKIDTTQPDAMDKAIKIAGQYSGDYLKQQLLKQQIETEKAQLGQIAANIKQSNASAANSYASAAKTKAETDALGVPLSVDGVISKLPKATQERYYKLQGDFDQATKNYRGAIDSANSITALSKDATAQDQTAIIFQYMKTLDPTSTVREGEFALVGSTAGLGDRAINSLKKLDNGQRLNESQIKDIVSATKTLADNARQNLDATSKEYDRRAVKFGLPTGLFYEPQTNTQTTQDNPFSQALGKSNETIQGTSIIQSMSNGIINFNIPTN